MRALTVNDVNFVPLSFFTGHLFNFSPESVGQTPLMPCTNNPYLRINFGQDGFIYEPANQPEHRLGMAALLHDYHRRRIVALAQAR